MNSAYVWELIPRDLRRVERPSFFGHIKMANLLRCLPGPPVEEEPPPMMIIISTLTMREVGILK
jgi:hypothetical protein